MGNFVSDNIQLSDQLYVLHENYGLKHCTFTYSYRTINSNNETKHENLKETL